MTPDVLELVADLAAAGSSDAAIGERLGVHRLTVFRWRRRAGIPSTPREAAPGHGTPGRYARGCPCPRCRASEAHRLTAWRTAQQDATRRAPRWGEPWTPDEDAVLLALGARAGARALGRTYYAATDRINLLRRPT